MNKQSNKKSTSYRRHLCESKLRAEQWNREENKIALRERKIQGYILSNYLITQEHDLRNSFGTPRLASLHARPTANHLLPAAAGTICLWAAL